MSISVSKQGWRIDKGKWIEYDSTRIGEYYDGYSKYYATEFRLTLDNDYDSLTLRFACSPNRNRVCRYATFQPVTPGTEGEEITITDNNTVTVEGDFAEGSVVSVFVWATSGAISYTTVGDASATGVEGGGLARVYHTDGFGKYEARIYDGEAWARYVPYAYENGEWRKMG